MPLRQVSTEFSSRFVLWDKKRNIMSIRTPTIFLTDVCPFLPPSLHHRHFLLLPLPSLACSHHCSPLPSPALATTSTATCSCRRSPLPLCALAAAHPATTAPPPLPCSPTDL